MAVSAFTLAGCAIAPGYTDAEQEMTETLQGSNFQPASREMRDNIETQELFAQAAFWSREYELNPGDLESAIKLSAAVRKLGNPQRAIEIAQTTRALYPRDPYLTAEFAAGLIAAERAQEAMKPLDDALRTAPGYARLWSLKGAALDQQEDYDLARKHYAKALQITPYDPNVMANVGLSFALSGDPVTAEGWLRRAVAIPGASQSVRQNLALILQLQGKDDEAKRYAGRKATPSLRPAPQTSHAQQSGAYKSGIGAYEKQANAAPQGYPAAQSYQPRRSTPSQQQLSGIPSSERGTRKQTYGAGQYPSRSLNATASVGGQNPARNSSPMTASDAARLAAQQSKRGKVVMPLQDTSQPTLEQRSVLEQISRGLGPKASGPQLAGAAPTAPQAYQAQPPQNYLPTQQQYYGQIQDQGRAPNRRRR
ncbi:tetratricopeptide repeat protein [Hellea balneolensis]|uniref:tetratricopeptide repeat protein n=1 Tax=Hellea balneolensis TaxID=287478 RepID=UPI000414F35F|nr:tetratricopeptide repeat protein [Hellea balneolensis]